jgi:Icc-related predicted phosphoesterase
VPVLAVLGNHDHHAGIPAQVTRVIESVGITVLEGTGRADPGYGRREPLEIYPFLGSYLLGQAIDDNDVALAVHGHAHAGTEHGTTPGGVPVRNVAYPVIGRAYRVWELGNTA